MLIMFVNLYKFVSIVLYFGFYEKKDAFFLVLIILYSIIVPVSCDVYAKDVLK